LNSIALVNYRGKNPTIISEDTEKTLGKIQHPFLILKQLNLLQVKYQTPQGAMNRHFSSEGEECRKCHVKRRVLVGGEGSMKRVDVFSTHVHTEH
jgi:hypothetical protein